MLNVEGFRAGAVFLVKLTGFVFRLTTLAFATYEHKRDFPTISILWILLAS